MALIPGASLAPTVSTPGPYGVPTWEDDPSLVDLQRAYDSVYGPTTTTAQVVPTPTPKPTYEPQKGSLSFLGTTPTNQQRVAMNIAKRELADTTPTAPKQAASNVAAVGNLAKSGSGLGLSAYGVSKSGLASQRGPEKYGFQSAMWDALQGAFKDMKAAGLGTPGITDGWRSYEAQVDVKRRKGNLAATPGRSVHGLGYAADLDLNPKQQKWLEANGAKYGLARLASESWHWQLVPSAIRRRA